MVGRVDGRDSQQVVDQAARPGTADGAADAGPGDEPGDIGNRQEVCGEPGGGDDAQFGGEALARRRPVPARPGEAAVHAILAPGTQQRERLTGDLGDEQLPDAEVGLDVQGAPRGETGGGGEQPGGPSRPAGSAGPGGLPGRVT